MKLFVTLLLCLIATSANAQLYKFKGDFVQTYMAKDGFLDTIPPGLRLNCEETMCSYLKSVRIYVFRDKESTKWFWSTDYNDVMFDESEKIQICGKTDHIVYYDETNQMLYRDQKCDHEVGKPQKESSLLLAFEQHTVDRKLD